MKFAVLGLGKRGGTYGKHLKNREGAEICAVCDLDERKVTACANAWGVAEGMRFVGDAKFFAAGKLADVLVIATQDKDHFAHTMTALELGYDVVVEKPLSPDVGECLKMEKLAREKGRKVLVCHVLRFAPYYQKIKEVLDSGMLGEIREIRHSENISYWHFAHSYVRGNWRRSAETSPMILAKCCHDMDLLYWFSGAKAKSLSSYGELKFFTSENAPTGATERCYDCPHKQTCNYETEFQYIGRKRAIGRGRRKFKWNISKAFCASNKKADIANELKNGQGKPYSRCVFRCDNDVVELQTVNMEMENGIKCSFVVSAFNEDNFRKTEIRGTKGELFADDRGSVLTLRLFGKREKKIRVNLIPIVKGHYGGDQGIAHAAANLDKFDPKRDKLSWISETVESHRIALAAELSRKSGGEKIDMKADIPDIEK